MGQPSSPSSYSGASAARSSSPAPTATEIVTRPDGMARGKWEAPPWVFWTILAIVVVVSLAYLLRRLGFLQIKKKSENDAAPPSSKMGTRR